MTNLEGRVAVVTGASRGIGKGIAEGLGEAGATVYVTGRSESHADPPEPLTVQADATLVRGQAGHVDLTLDREPPQVGTPGTDVTNLFEQLGRQTPLLLGRLGRHALDGSLDLHD